MYMKFLELTQMHIVWYSRNYFLTATLFHGCQCWDPASGLFWDLMSTDLWGLMVKVVVPQAKTAMVLLLAELVVVLEEQFYFFFNFLVFRTTQLYQLLEDVVAHWVEVAVGVAEFIFIGLRYTWVSSMSPLQLLMAAFTIGRLCSWYTCAFYLMFIFFALLVSSYNAFALSRGFGWKFISNFVCTFSLRCCCSTMLLLILKLVTSYV